MSDETLAEVLPVPREYRGKLLSGENAMMENGLFYLQVVLFLAITAAPVILGGLAATGKLGSDFGFAPVPIGMACTAGLMWFLFGQLVNNPWSAGYIFNQARAEIAKRPDSLVDLSNDKAILVEVIPRRNWGMVMLQKAEDRGFLFVDEESRQLLIEGDSKRYRIPAAAVIGTEVVVAQQSAMHKEDSSRVGVVLVTVRDSMGEREIPLRPVRTIGGDTLGSDFAARAYELERRIVTICST